MINTQEALAAAIEANAELLLRYLEGFDDDTHTAQAPALPNHIAWTLGHCALTMHRCAELADGQPPSPQDFRDDPPPPNNRIPMRYYTESVAFGSTPALDAMIYPPIESAIMIYENACKRLAATVRACSDDDLERHHPWGAAELPFRLLVTRIMFHNGMHAGQIADLRRALGLGSIFTNAVPTADDAHPPEENASNTALDDLNPARAPQEHIPA